VSLFCAVRIAKLEAGEKDDYEFREWQARMDQLDREKKLEEFERRRLTGRLCQEQSVIARQKMVVQKKHNVAEMRAEVAL